jgi:hypothetical protein
MNLAWGPSRIPHIQKKFLKKIQKKKNFRENPGKILGVLGDPQAQGPRISNIKKKKKIRRNLTYTHFNREVKAIG